MLNVIQFIFNYFRCLISLAKIANDQKLKRDHLFTEHMSFISQF